MTRNALCVGVALLVLGAGMPASADGINVARFLINHQREKSQPRAVKPFDAAFGMLQARARGGTRGPARVLMQSKLKQRILDGRARLTGSRELLFDGKRAYLRYATTSSALRPQSTTATVRVPLGRMFGWYGKRLVKAAFPDVTPRKMARALGR